MYTAFQPLCISEFSLERRKKDPNDVKIKHCNDVKI